jgi:serine/threonine protein kinase/tetratricopeptide (TPR) repeat protein
MTPERWKQIEEIFFSAMDLPEAERAALLDRACGDDWSLRQEIERLLGNDGQAEGFITRTDLSSAQATTGRTVAGGPKAPGESDATRVDRRVGAYRLVREIGRGGMGAVYLAVRADNEFHQRVAIKVLKRGMDTDFIVRRFRNERQILAGFDHPNIARLLDGGTTDDGLPYFVMEYIEGLPIHRYCDAHQLPVEKRLRLFREVCAAVAYAHERQVIHRDIKPANILVTSAGQPKLLDFGIAKILDPDLSGDTLDSTLTSIVLMTPDYASPEQARGERVTPASDQYSLGVLLYELLTGHRPYHVRNRLPHEVARILAEENPPLPSEVISRTAETTSADGQKIVTASPEIVSLNRGVTLNSLRRQLAGELDGIVMQAMAKMPAHRYAGVRELSAEIGRHMQGEAVTAITRESLRDQPTLTDAVSPSTQVTSIPHDRPARSAWPIAIVLAAIVAIAASVYWSRPKPGAGSTAGTHGIAVLPFRGGATNETAVSWGLGLADTLTTKLGQVKQLSVRPASSVRRYQQNGMEPLLAGRELGVEYVVSGSLQHSGDRVRVSAQMLHVPDGAVLWADRFDEPVSELAKLQNLIAERVLRTMTMELSGAEQRQFSKSYTSSSEAYQLYLVGLYQMGKRNVPGLHEAIKVFNQALKHDDRFGLAYAGLANCHALLNIYEVPAPPDAYSRARDNAMKALALDETLAEAHAALGYVKFFSDRDRAGGEREVRRAIELNPSYATAHQWLGIFLSAMGRHDEALAEIKAAESLDPRSAIIKSAAGMLHYYARRYDDALDLTRQALELDPGLVPGHRVARWIYQARRQYDDALASYVKEKSFSGGADQEWPAIRAQVEASGARLDAARAAVRRDAGFLNYEVGVAHAMLADADPALAWLAKSEAAREYSFNFVQVDPRLDLVRDDPRFADLLRKAGFRGN